MSSKVFGQNELRNLSYGNERIWINSAGDWGCSDPLAVPKARVEMLRRGHSKMAVKKVTYDNPKYFLSQNSNFKLIED